MMQIIPVKPYNGPHQMTQEEMAAIYARFPDKKEKLDRIFADHITVCTEMRMKQDEINDSIEHARARAKKGTDYQLLGLTGHIGELTRKTVQSAYRKQAQKCHPDKGGNPSQFKKLNAAYQRVLATLPKEEKRHV